MVLKRIAIITITTLFVLSCFIFISSVDVNGNMVHDSHILCKIDGFTVSFYQRAVKRASYREMSIEDIETSMNVAHGEIILNPFCCVDRWYDMHYMQWQ